MRLRNEWLATLLACAVAFGLAKIAQADLEGYWSFDGNANDQSGGGNNGTLVNSPGFSGDVPAQIGSGQSLDITANLQGVQIISPPASFNASNFTLAYWMKNPAPAGQAALANRLTSRTGNRFETAVTNAGGGVGGVGNGLIIYSATNPSWRSAGAAPTLDEWTHVAYVYDGSTITTYTNGSPAGSQALNIRPTGDLAIGMTAAGTESFIGRIDDVALWDNRLPQSAIADLAAGTATPLTVSVPLKNPVGYWTFDGYTHDQSGNGHHGSNLLNVSYSSDTPFGLGSGSSLVLGGSTRVDIPADPALDSRAFTLAYWFNQGGATQNGTYERITSRGGDTFETAVSGDGSLSFYSPGAGWQDTGHNLPANGWQHVAIVSNGATVDTYVNGTYVSTGAIGGDPAGILRIGARANIWTEGVEGRIDDVALWDDVLSADQIAALASGTSRPAGVISVTSDPTQWLLSTERSAGGPGGTWTPSGDPLPDLSTYTVAASPTGQAHILAAAADLGAGTLLGDGGNGLAAGVQYYRTTFDLDPSGDVGANIVLAVDNGAQIFINGTEVARETSFLTENWARPYSSLSINGDGSISDVTLFDWVAPSFSDWRAGTNEVVLAIRNPDTEGLGAGGLAFRMDINGAGAPPPPALPSATVISDPDLWMLSTERRSGGPAGTWSPSGDPPPDASTFTLAASPTTTPGILAAAANLGVETLLGDGGAGQPEGLLYYRTTFDLEPFTDISANLVLAVDNGAQVFINGVEVARETSFLVENWAPPYSSLTINEDGTISDVTLFDWVAPSFENWRIGENEIILAVRNPDSEGLMGGGIAFRMELFTRVPEPAGLCLLALGGLCLAGCARRKRRRRGRNAK